MRDNVIVMPLPKLKNWYSEGLIDEPRCFDCLSHWIHVFLVIIEVAYVIEDICILANNTLTVIKNVSVPHCDAILGSYIEYNFDCIHICVQSEFIS